ncbi:hypothetical protein Tsp_14094, partial [Trichinella spiralis]|uniref:hypothetical protein n=1 Tax=Trichinella spiralis TaxID=6334 RepID=UPI0001EFE28F
FYNVAKAIKKIITKIEKYLRFLLSSQHIQTKKRHEQSDFLQKSSTPFNVVPEIIAISSYVHFGGLGSSVKQIPRVSPMRHRQNKPMAIYSKGKKVPLSTSSYNKNHQIPVMRLS